jgi:hypothetical protein
MCLRKTACPNYVIPLPVTVLNITAVILFKISSESCKNKVSLFLTKAH